MGNYWEDVVYSSPPLDSLEHVEMSATFDWLSHHLPVNAGKIDWIQVRGNHSHWRIDDEELLAAKAAAEVLERVRSGSTVEHVGDGLSPYGVRIGDDGGFLMLAALLEIPEHHYFIAEDRTWIVVVSMEGDLDVVDQLDLQGLDLD